MGYSLSTPCRSRPDRDRLAAFLREHLRPFSRVLLTSPEVPELRKVARWWPKTEAHERIGFMYDPTTYVHVGRELAYGRGPSKIGFNFSMQGFYGTWMHTVLSWAALQVGRRRGLNALSVVGHADQSVPYITYDSNPIPVLSEADIADWTPEAQDYARWNWLVSPLGLRVFEDATHYSKRVYGQDVPDDFTIKDKELEKLIRQVVEREMQRIDALWKGST